MNTGGVSISGSYLTISNNYIYNLRSTGIFTIDSLKVPNVPNSVSIINNTIKRSNQGILVKGNNWVITGNEIDRLIVYADDPQDDDADYIRFFGNNNTFSRNYLHGTRVSEIGASHVDCWQTFGDNGEWASNTVIDSNICDGFYHEGLMSSSDGVAGFDNLMISNNVFANSASWGLVVGIPNTKVYHNIFINMQNNGVGFRVQSGVFNGINGIVKDNIFYNAPSGGPHAIHFIDNGAYSYIASKNLLYDSSGTIDSSYTSGNSFSNYAADIRNKNPLFVNVNNLVGSDGIPFTNDDGYRIQTGSPAINAGTNVGVSKDILGNSRPKGAGYDIGAYEY